MKIAALIPAVAVVLVPSVATAQAAPSSERWVGSIGMTAVTLPTYLGSNRYRVRAFPIFQVEYKERAYIGGAMGGTGAGAGLYLLRNETFSLSTEITGAPERKESYGDGLAGMGRRGAATFAASNVSYQVGSLTAGASVAIGLGSDEGSWGTFKLAQKKLFARRWITEVSTGATFANSRNMSYDFGVSTDQASRRQALIAAGDSRLYANEGKAYAPGHGLKQAQVSTSLGYLLTSRMTAIAFATGSRLGREAADSPLTRQRNSLVAGTGVAFGF